MAPEVKLLERQRLARQSVLDGERSPAERNRLGQFATPSALAHDILSYAARLFPPEHRVSFLDPAVGTGAFYSALRRRFSGVRIEAALGFEIDSSYGNAASEIWRKFGLDVRLSDFTKQEPFRSFNLVICNPPYVRHHHLEEGEKAVLQQKSKTASGMKVSGLAGLYCHFLAISHAWMAEGGLAGWLIPSEFMDVNYGREVKRYLLEKVTLVHIHRFDPNDVQFADALVSSAIVWFIKSPPPKNHSVRFTFGGSLAAPKASREVPSAALVSEQKWTRFPTNDIRPVNLSPTISDFFRIKRGLATGDNGYFILGENQIEERGLPIELFSPILPSPRYLSEDVVNADSSGLPEVERRLFLLNTKLPEKEIQVRYPRLFEYLEEGIAKGLHERYLCRHRSPWYSQENRPPAPIVCTYLGRGDSKSGRPFRFILNKSRATVANVYLAMYPTPLLARASTTDPSLFTRVWKILNSITPSHLLGEGRVYGGGLHKLEPKELGNVPVSEIAELIGYEDEPVKQREALSDLAA
jgi:adenine-specific DNA-methyltransferase